MENLYFIFVLLFVLAVLGLNFMGLYAAIKAHSVANDVNALRRELKRVRDRLQRMESSSAAEKSVRAVGSEAATTLAVSKPSAGPASAPAPTPKRGVEADGRERSDRPRADSKAPARPARPQTVPTKEPSLSPGPKVALPAATAAAAGSAGTVAERSVAASEAPSRGRVQVPRTGLEEQLGARLPVWLGSIALALAGTFLVKYAFDSGWFSPPARIALGVLFGLGLLGAGELLRERIDRIPAGLSAAGIAVLYASFLSARHVFDPPLLTAVVTFVLMALTTALAIFLSLRQGQIVALIGMVGGFLTPQLVGGGPESDPLTVFGYLFLLQIGILSVSRKREWTLMGAVAPVAAIAWVLLWTLDPARQSDAPFLGFFVLATLATSVYTATSGDPDRAWRGQGLASMLNWLVAGSALLALSRLTLLRYSYWEWAYLGLLALGGIVMARLDKGSRPLPFVAAATIALLHLTWATGDASPAAYGALWVLAALGATIALGSAWAIRGSERKAPWALLGASVGLVYPVVGHLGANDLGRDLAWEWIYLAVAATCAAAALPGARRRLTAFAAGARSSRDEDDALSALTLAAAASSALAVPVGLSEMPVGFTLAWALELWVVVMAAGILRLPRLRAFAWPLTALVAFRLLGGYEVFDYPWQRRPVFNRTAMLYGLPAAAFVAASWRACRDGDTRLGNALGNLATAFGFVLIGLELRNVFQDSLLGGHVSFQEAASYGPAWLIFALVLLLAGRRLSGTLHGAPVARPALSAAGVTAVAASETETQGGDDAPTGGEDVGEARTPLDPSPLPWLAPAGAVVGAIAVIFHLFWPSLVLNPWFVSTELGSLPILNQLLAAFALPALLSFGLASLQRGRNGTSSRIFLVGAVTFGAVFLALQMRHLSGGGRIETPVTLGEWGTLSGLWIAAGIGLIWLERRRFGAWFDLRGGGIALAMIGVAVAILVPGLVRNPALLHIAVGERIVFNQLLFGFGLPALLSILAGYVLLRWPGQPDFPDWPASVAGLWMLFLFVTLEVRHAFRGTFLDELPSGVESFQEAASYGPAWLILALLLLLAERRLSGVADGEPVVKPVASTASEIAGEMPAIATAADDDASTEREGVSEALVREEKSPLPWFTPAGAFIGAIAVAFHLFWPSLVLSPWFTSTDLGALPILNQLMAAFALPALLSFALANLQRGRNGTSSRIFLVGAIASGAVFLALQMRHLSGGGRIEPPATLGEWGTLSGLWIAAGVGLIWLERRRFGAWFDLRGGGIALAMIGVAVAILVPGLARNPAVLHISVGERIVFNQVLFGFGLPALLSILAGRALQRWTGKPVFPAWPASAAGLWMLFLFVTLEVRQAFRGGFLDDRPTGAVRALGTSLELATLESYAYSLAWVLLAVALLLAGIASRGRPVRFASLAVMLLAVLKVFLYDTAQLGDLLRVFSFLGLGLSLLLLSYLYQRYVFVDRPILPGAPRGGERAGAEGDPES